jgi:DNA-directed RNA polymerase subunit N (RpoN/RPB10)
VFRDEGVVAYILAESHRRQVLNAVLAAGSRLDEPSADDEQFERLLTGSAKSLIADAYGSCPSGFLTLLDRCDELGHPAEFYRFWHSFLAENVGAIREIASSSVPVWELYRVLKNLPAELRTIGIACRFGEHVGTGRFVEAVRWMHCGQPDAGVWRAVRERLERGASPRKILDGMLAEARCPTHYLVDARFRHIATVGELKRAAKRFENCLGMDFTIEEALRGEAQFYEWVGEGQAAIVSITNDLPFGWILGSIKGVGNVEPELETHIHITEALAEQGVVGRMGVMDMVSGVPRTMGRRRERDVASLWEGNG